MAQEANATSVSQEDFIVALQHLNTLSERAKDFTDEKMQQVFIERSAETFARTHPSFGDAKSVSENAKGYMLLQIVEDKEVNPTNEVQKTDVSTPLTVQQYATAPGKGQLTAGANIDQSGLSGGGIAIQTGVWKSNDGPAQVTASGGVNFDSEGNVTGGTLGAKATTDLLYKNDGHVDVGIAGVSTSIPTSGTYDPQSNSTAYAGIVDINGKNAVIGTVSSGLDGKGLNLHLSDHYTVYGEGQNQVEINAGADYKPQTDDLGLTAGVVARHDNLFIKAAINLNHVNSSPDVSANITPGVEF